MYKVNKINLIKFEETSSKYFMILEEARGYAQEISKEENYGSFLIKVTETVIESYNINYKLLI